MSKFLLNLVLQIFKAFVYSKIQFLFEKNFFLRIQPTRPSLARAGPLRTAGRRACSAHPGLRGLGVIAKNRLYFEFAQPGDDAFSLCHRQAGPTCQIHPLPRVSRPRSEIPRAAAPSRRCPAPRMPPSFYSLPSSLSPLNPLQTEH
jgi:hypothetical protein